MSKVVETLERLKEHVVETLIAQVAKQEDCLTYIPPVKIVSMDCKYTIQYKHGEKCDVAFSLKNEGVE